MNKINHLNRELYDFLSILLKKNNIDISDYYIISINCTNYSNVMLVTMTNNKNSFIAAYNNDEFSFYLNNKPHRQTDNIIQKANEN